MCDTFANADACRQVLHTFQPRFPDIAFLPEGRQFLEIVTERIAQEADFIVNGYAFICKDGEVSVWNLHDITRASVRNKDSEVMETTMDEIEVGIVQAYWERNKQFAEDGTTGR